MENLLQMKFRYRFSPWMIGLCSFPLLQVYAADPVETPQSPPPGEVAADIDNTGNIGTALSPAGNGDNDAKESFENHHAESTIEPGITLKGMGWLTNRELRRTLQLLLPSGSTDAPLQRNNIEDAAYLLQGETRNRGHLSPTIHFTLFTESGDTWKGSWQQEGFNEPLPPRDQKFKRMEIEIDRGVLYYFEHLEIQGTSELDTEPELFFYTKGFLFNTESNRYYSPARKTSGIQSILTEFNRLGYLDAELIEEEENIDPETGAVSLKLAFRSGPRYWIRRVETRTLQPQDSPVVEVQHFTDTPFSPIWLQDHLQSLRRPWYPQGYPDARVRVLDEQQEQQDGQIIVDLTLEIDPGPAISTGTIHFEGIGHTREHFLRKLIPLHEGETFNILEAEIARQRLARLGIFEVVEIHYPERNNNQQDVIYKVTPRPNYDVSLLAGYGSYETIRGGVEVIHRNIWGRAHQSKLRAVQSLKSTRAEYIYTIPEVWTDSGNVFAKLNYLDRKEVTFHRHEFGGALGTDYYWKALDLQTSLQYSYETVKSRNKRFTEAPGVSSAQVGSLQLTLSRNRLDNMLYPTRGYKIFSSYEYASKILGGNVDFQRLEAGMSYHTPISGGLVFHSSVRHGLAWSNSATRDNLPINRRFFPGGENSIRGYTEGKASPLSANDKEIGAEIYLLFNFELEQPIMPDLSVVVFTDILGASAGYAKYPADYWLTSVGVGLRYRTIIGPVRLEYGHNLNPRQGAPSGALHFSIGFPF